MRNLPTYGEDVAARINEAANGWFAFFAAGEHPGFVFEAWRRRSPRCRSESIASTVQSSLIAPDIRAGMLVDLMGWASTQRIYREFAYVPGGFAAVRASSWWRPRGVELSNRFD